MSRAGAAVSRIVVRNLRKAFRDATRELVIIEDLSFDFPQCRSLAIVGRSGIGKSTLLYLLAGLERPCAGSIEYFGQTDIVSLGEEDLTRFRGREIGFVFQAHHLLGEFSAAENVAMPLIIAGESEREALKRACELLDKVGLAQRVTHRPGELSAGEQQRVAIARAVVAKPKIVLADEPTGSLDVETSRQIQGLLTSLVREMDLMLVVVTHSRELAGEMEAIYEMLPGGGLQHIRA